MRSHNRRTDRGGHPHLVTHRTEGSACRSSGGKGIARQVVGEQPLGLGVLRCGAQIRGFGVEVALGEYRDGRLIGRRGTNVNLGAIGEDRIGDSQGFRGQDGVGLVDRCGCGISAQRSYGFYHHERAKRRRYRFG